jgi:hypothetical protein
VKPAEARRLAEAYSLEQLAHAASHLGSEEDPEIDIGGEDHGEKLTHVLLAMRIRERVELAGDPLRDAFRAVMAEVRHVLTNED